MLCDTRLLLNMAKDRGVCAFNIYNFESLKAIVDVAEELLIPVIIQVSEGGLEYGGGLSLVNLVKTHLKGTKAPYALHLDHGRDIDVIRSAIKWGFTSIMVDGSHLPFKENLKFTQMVVDIAHRAGIPVEAELGTIGGTEDKITGDMHLVDPEEAEIFVRKTGVDFLAPAVGTSHGAFKFKGKQEIRFDLIEEVSKRTGVPLVLHGASSLPGWLLDEAKRSGVDVEGMNGVPYEVLKEAVRRGIRKLNADTDLRIAFITGLRNSLRENPGVIDPRKHLNRGMEWIKRIVRERMEILWNL